MEKKNKTGVPNAATLAVVAVAFMLVGVFAGANLAATPKPAATSYGTLEALLASDDTSFYDNWISVEVIHADGSREPTQYAHNNVTELGFNFTRDVLSGLGVPPINGSLNNWTVIELSTDNVGASRTTRTCPSVVTGNGLNIARATTIIKQGTGNYTASVTFTVTGTQSAITKVCLSNDTASAGANGLMAHALISSTNVANGDTLVVNYSVAAT